MTAPPQAGGQRRWALLAVAVVLVAVGVATCEVIGGGGSSGAGASAPPTSLVAVRRQTLSQTTQFDGTLGYAGSYTVLGRAPGTVTWLPRIGQVIHQGQVVYRVDEVPVVLLYGSIPAYRILAAGETGRDVEQLNHDLVALGDVGRPEVESAWDRFSWATRAGVEKLQNHLGVVEPTGALSMADVVFLPGAARVTAVNAQLGGAGSGPVLQATSTARTVSVALDPDLQSQVKKGDRVTITLPDGRTSPGRVTAVGRVATVPPGDAAVSGGSESGPTVPVSIRPTDPNATGSLDQALVEVAITDRTVRDVLAVPVAALLARFGGGYSVEVVAEDGVHHLVPVRLGLFDDAAGMVAVSGPGLKAGQRVVVPGYD